MKSSRLGGFSQLGSAVQGDRSYGAIRWSARNQSPLQAQKSSSGSANSLALSSLAETGAYWPANLWIVLATIGQCRLGTRAITLPPGSVACHIRDRQLSRATYCS